MATFASPTAKIPEEAARRLRNGCDDERELVQMIRAHLLTREQRLALAEANLDVADCLNGAYGEAEETTVLGIYAEWNRRLGFRAFGG